MGFLDFLFGKKCRYCGAKGAKEEDGRVRCPNPQCGCFDPELYRTHNEPRRTGSRLASRQPFLPQQSVAIRYRNFKGEDRSFTADAATLRRKKNHLSVCVAPTGQRITLARNRIQNLEEVESTAPRPLTRENWPTPRERQVLAYHKKYKTTSPLYEQIRAKYPDW